MFDKHKTLLFIVPLIHFSDERDCVAPAQHSAEQWNWIRLAFLLSLDWDVGWRQQWAWLVETGLIKSLIFTVLISSRWQWVNHDQALPFLMCLWVRRCRKDFTSVSKSDLAPWFYQTNKSETEIENSTLKADAHDKFWLLFSVFRSLQILHHSVLQAPSLSLMCFYQGRELM